MHKKRSYIYFLLLAFTLAYAPISLLAALPKNTHKFTLVLDAGHGGKDPGATGKFSKEKNINLNVTLEVGRLIENNCPDVKVIYTRKTDSFISLNRRAEIANNAKADLFISIHTNSLPKKHIAYGTETYTLGMARADENLDVAKRENSVILIEDNYMEHYAGFNPRSSESYIMFEFMQDQYMKQSVGLARLIQEQYVCTAGRKNKGVHQSGLLVLRATSMPSVLTEIGFISTPEEERYLNTQRGIQQIAKSIYLGFVNYKKTQNGTGSKPTARQADTQERRQETKDKKEDNTPDQIPAPKEDCAKQDKETEGSSEQTGNSEETVGNENKTDEKPVFKIQLLTSDRKLRPNDRQFKGLTGVCHYRENGLYKYTYKESTDYAEINRQRKAIATKFPKAFVVAFRNEERMNLQEAIRESRKQR